MTDHANELRRHARKIPHPQGETPGVMLRAADEIERLATKLKAAEKERDFAKTEIARLHDDIRELTDERVLDEEDRDLIVAWRQGTATKPAPSVPDFANTKDAARYRWLRENGLANEKRESRAVLPRSGKKASMAFRYWTTPEELDMTIDAMISAAPEAKP